jgi:hypothetical protein
VEKYYIHKTGNRALKISDDNYLDIRFYLDTTYDITKTKGKYNYTLEVFNEVTRDELIDIIQSKTLDNLMEQNLKLEERLLENKRKILNLSRMKYDNI